MTRLLDLTNSATISRCPATADAGTTLRVWRKLYCHYGIADGCGGVIHASKQRGVVRESLKEFEKGGVAQIDNSITSGDLRAAYEKAQSDIDKPYSLFSDNCEHFVRCAHGLPKESHQVQHAVIGGVTAVGLESKNPAVKILSSGALVGSFFGKNPLGGAVLGGIGALLLQAIFGNADKEK